MLNDIHLLTAMDGGNAENVESGSLPTATDGGSAENAGSSFLPDGLKLRQAQKTDQVFMRQLFGTTRAHLQQLPLPKPHIDALIDQQYQLQQTYYAGQWPDASTLIIQLGANAIGKIIIDENKTALHIIDIALEPAMRGKGYGTAILRALQAVAQKRGLPVRLSVDYQNLPAKKLYLRLGFHVTGTSDTHESMTWSPSVPATSHTDHPTGNKEEACEIFK